MRAEWVAVAVLIAIGLYAIVVFNRLIRARNLVREGWSGIDVQLVRRSDLIPNLVETVKGYAGHERTLFAEIAQKRTQALNTTGVSSRAAAEQELQASVRRMLAVAEAYPELKAQPEFPRIAETARRARRPAAARAALLQRHGSRLQHRYPVISRSAARAGFRVSRGALFRDRGHSGSVGQIDGSLR